MQIDSYHKLKGKNGVMAGVNPFEGYRITSPYGYRSDPLGNEQPEFHKGIDLVKYDGAPIAAFVPGVVVHAGLGQTGTGLGGYGIIVVVKDRKGALHLYAHLASAAVQVNDEVKQGQVIGRQGSTGQSTGSHLHYEIRLKSSPYFGLGSHTDPTLYLQDYFAEEEQQMEELRQQLEALTARVGGLEARIAEMANLKTQVDGLEQRIAELESNASLEVPPEWARDAVNAAVEKGILAEPNGGSYDFYRMLTVLHRNGTF